MNDNNTNVNAGSSAKKRYLRLGGYSAAITFAVIAIAVVVNLIVGRLPANITKFDTSSLGLFTLSEQTKEIVRAIDEDITVYYIGQTGKEDNTILQFLARYTAINGRIRVEKVDPDFYPNFVGQYTAEALSSDSLIVVSNRRSKTVDKSEIIVENYSFDANYNVSVSTSFDGESAVTSALDFVTSGDLPKVYLLTGHMEAALSQTTADYIKKDNIETAELSLLTAEAVPADATCVFINAPASDINADEAKKLIAYIDGGGAVMLITGYDPNTPGADMPNLWSVGAHMGISAEYGLVTEGSANNYLQVPYYLIPKLGTHEIVTTLPSENINTFLPFTMGLKIMGNMPRATVKAHQLLYTTASAYLKTGEFETVEKAEGDETGVFCAAAAATDGTSKLVWYSSSFIVDENADMYVSGGNSTFFLNSLKWMTGKTTSVSIASKRLQVPALMLNETEGNVWGAVVSAVIPLAVLGVGFAVWSKRRKR